MLVYVMLTAKQLCGFAFHKLTIGNDQFTLMEIP